MPLFWVICPPPTQPFYRLGTLWVKPLHSICPKISFPIFLEGCVGLEKGPMPLETVCTIEVHSIGDLFPIGKFGCRHALGRMHVKTGIVVSQAKRWPEARKEADPSQDPSGGSKILIFDLQSPEPWDNNTVCKPLGLWFFVLAALGTNTFYKILFWCMYFCKSTWILFFF
jgi:hypothetical protein